MVTPFSYHQQQHHESLDILHVRISHKFRISKSDGRQLQPLY
jgi:hypothetical protein